VGWSLHAQGRHTSSPQHPQHLAESPRETSSPCMSGISGTRNILAAHPSATTVSSADSAGRMPRGFRYIELKSRRGGAHVAISSPRNAVASPADKGTAILVGQRALGSDDSQGGRCQAAVTSLRSAIS
jgi:hypothetical protein